MTTENLHDLTAAYALDALDSEERATYEAHLHECDDCRAELASLEDTVSVLAYANEGPTPATGLRDRIVTAARAEPPRVVALRPRRTRYYAAAGAVAAAAALAIGLWAGLSGGSASPKLALVLHGSGSPTLTASHFDPAPEGKVYEIWVILVGDKTPRPAGLFRDDGRFALTRAAPKGATVAVTLEDAPMATAPTTRILASTTV